MRIASCLIVAACLAGGAFSAYGANPQQEKMKACNAQASEQHLSGDSRKTFMKTCLSADGSNGTLTAQQQKMKTCNADATAKNLKGAERKAFMSSCLKAQ